MKQNNLIYLSFILVFASCTKTKTPESLLSRWEKNIQKESVLERKLASGSNKNASCVSDIFTIDTLKAEIKELEKQYVGAQSVHGSWRHLSLSSLPVPQANFLKRYGDQIGDLSNPNAIDYSMCDDVPCIYNQIYGKGDHIAGYVHYIWYLKFGHMLSADNEIPADQRPGNSQYVKPVPGIYNGKSIPLADYLYNDRELYAFWRLSLMLKAPHTTLDAMTEIQRIPRGEKFTKSPDACGLASTLGWIQLQDGCLKVDERNMDRGYLYPALTHEMSHQVDFHEARGGTGFYRSHRPDYIAFTGMTFTEFMQPSGFMERKWEVPADTTTKFISKYAQTNPQENFAESLAYFRIEGNRTKESISDSHYQFVSSNYYQSRSFEVESMINGWLQQYAANIGNQVFKAVMDCHQKPGNVRSVYFSRSDFTTPVVPSVLNCIGANAEFISQDFKSKVSISEPDACNTQKEHPGKLKWDPSVKAHLAKAFDKYLIELQNDKQYLARIQTYYKEISNKEIAREAYLQCYGESDEQACFASEINKGAYEKASTLKLPPEKTQELADMYGAYHSYSSIQQESLKAYQVIVASNNEAIEREVEDLWESCKLVKHDDIDPPTGKHFQPQGGYLISSFYNCLNNQIPDSINTLVHNISVSGLKVQHPKEEVVLMNGVTPVYQTFLQGLYTKEQEAEFNKAVDYMGTDNGAIRFQILSDFSWVKSASNTQKISSDCKSMAYNLIPFQPLYHLKKDLFSNYVGQSICQDVPNSPQFRKWVETSKAAFSQKVAPLVDTKLETFARSLAQECAQKYPVKSILVRLVNKLRRESCVADSRVWQEFEYKLLIETANDPAVKKNQISQETIQNHLSEKRYPLQQQMIQEYFSK